MNIEEAKKIAGVVIHADGGCVECVSELCDRLNKNFPGFIWEYKRPTLEPYFEGEITVTERSKT